MYSILTFDTLDSTSDEAKRRIREGAAVDGQVIVAHSQTVGRGRQGRVWESVAGNLYFSILLKMSGNALTAQLSFVTALALGRVIAAMLPDPTLVQYKWPNDILLGGQKVAGILLESLQDWLVIGVGVNVAGCPVGLDRPVTHLQQCVMEKVDLDALLPDFLQSYEICENLWKNKGFSVIRAEWLKSVYRPGEQITVRLPGEQVTGTFVGLSETGELEVVVDGQMRRIAAGEVFFNEIA